MSNLNWSNLRSLQFGRYAEYYAKMEFASYGFEIYTPEIDDHGVDFVVRHKGEEEFYEVQVKGVRKNNYWYILKDKLTISDKFLICYLRFADGKLPDLYVFPTSVWKKPNALFVDRPYESTTHKSKPEYGFSYNQKNAPLIEPYRADNFFKQYN